MTFIYSIKIETDAKEDVNQKFRDNKLRGEVIVDDRFNIYICPQISHKSWSVYPKSKQLITQYDKQWEQVIKDTLQYMQAHYSVITLDSNPKWRKISNPARCPKMDLYIKNQDLVINETTT